MATPGPIDPPNPWVRARETGRIPDDGPKMAIEIRAHQIVSERIRDSVRVRHVLPRDEPGGVCAKRLDRNLLLGGRADGVGDGMARRVMAVVNVIHEAVLHVPEIVLRSDAPEDERRQVRFRIGLLRDLTNPLPDTPRVEPPLRAQPAGHDHGGKRQNASARQRRSNPPMLQESETFKQRQRGEHQIRINQNQQVCRIGAAETAMSDEDIGDHEEQPGPPARSSKERPGHGADRHPRPDEHESGCHQKPCVEVIPGERQAVEGRKVSGVIDQQPAVGERRPLSLPERKDREERNHRGEEQDYHGAQTLDDDSRRRPDRRLSDATSSVGRRMRSSAATSRSGESRRRNQEVPRPSRP